MKVAWIHSFPPAVVSSGIFMHLLADAVWGQGCEVSLFYTGNLRWPLNFMSAPRRLGKLTKGFDLIHAQYGSGCGYVTSRLRGPKVLSLRGSDWYGDGVKNHVHSFLARRFTCASLGRYDLVICVSERMAGEVKRKASPGRLEVLPAGINLGAFAPMSRDKARELLGEAGDDRPWILFSTLMQGNPVKRPWLARKVVELVRREVPDIQLKVMSGLPHDRVPTLVNACDAVLLTSTHEGWPNIVKEGLACNVPFVSTDVSDLQAIAEAEPTCQVTEPTPEALSQALLATLRQGRPNTLRRHAEPMELGLIAGRLIEIYRQLLANGPG